MRARCGLENNGKTSNGNQAALYTKDPSGKRDAIVSGTGMKLTTLLFWQQTTFALHEPPPTPMTEMGEQSSPRRTSTPCTTMPSSPRRRDVTGSLA